MGFYLFMTVVLSLRYTKVVYLFHLPLCHVSRLTIPVNLYAFEYMALKFKDFESNETKVDLTKTAMLNMLRTNIENLISTP